MYAHTQPNVLFGSNSPYNGHSTQNARLIVLDAENGQPAVDISDPANASYLMAPEPNSFFNNPFLPVAQKRSPVWTNHVLYYGLTISRNEVTGIDSGALYRLQMVDTNGDPLSVSQWKLKRFYQTDRPVTGAVNSTYDNRGNLWVLFGTGRLWSQEDIAPCAGISEYAACVANHDQYIFGVKEGIDPITGYMTFEDKSRANLVDVSGAKVFNDGSVTGLTSQTGITTGVGGTAQYYTLAAEIKASGVGGYKRKLSSGEIYYPNETHNYEMIITQPKLISMGSTRSYMAFTSFEPKETSCGENGYGYLYLVDTFTGLPEPQTYSAFYTGENSATVRPASLQPNQVPGVLSTGSGLPTEAFVTVSAAGVTVSASSPNMDRRDIYLEPGVAGDARGITSWKEVMNYGFEITPDKMIDGLDGGI
ncbi:MAG: hypothetical protein LBF22_01085 [Deltaproteobacteria bacterium]|nr:hypothetical protein [Deltaproteobacteria bacterium]